MLLPESYSSGAQSSTGYNPPLAVSVFSPPQKSVIPVIVSASLVDGLVYSSSSTKRFISVSKIRESKIAGMLSSPSPYSASSVDSSILKLS